MSKSNKEPTLEQVAQAFKIWRDSKTYGRERTPRNLWELVRAIAPFYPRRKIEVALSITKEQLDREAPITGLGEPSQELHEMPETEFVELSMPELPSMRLESLLGSALTITRGDGSSWMISAASRDVISESLRLFLGS